MLMFTNMKNRLGQSPMLFDTLNSTSEFTRTLRGDAEEHIYKLVSCACYASVISSIEDILGISSPDWVYLPEEDKRAYQRVVREITHMILSSNRYEDQVMDYLEHFAVGILRKDYDIDAFDGESFHRAVRGVADGIYTTYKVVSSTAAELFASLTAQAYVIQDKLDTLFLISYQGQEA